MRHISKKRANFLNFKKIQTPKTKTLQADMKHGLFILNNFPPLIRYEIHYRDHLLASRPQVMPSGLILVLHYDEGDL